MHWVNRIYTGDRSVSAICPRANLLPSHLLRLLMRRYPLQRKQCVKIGLLHPKRMGVSSRTEGERDRDNGNQCASGPDLCHFSGPWNLKSRTQVFKVSKFKGFYFIACCNFQVFSDISQFSVLIKNCKSWGGLGISLPWLPWACWGEDGGQTCLSPECGLGIGVRGDEG